MVRTLRSNLDRRNKSTLKKRTRSKNNFNRKSINKRKTNRKTKRKTNRKTNRKYNKKYINQKGGDNTYELLRLVCGDLQGNPTYDFLKQESADLGWKKISSNQRIAEELGEGWKFFSRVRSSDLFKTKIKNLIRGESVVEWAGWKDSKGYLCKDWTPEKCKSTSRGGVFEKRYSEEDMNAVRENCPITCSGDDPAELLKENISKNKRTDFVKPDINFSGSSFDWPNAFKDTSTSVEGKAAGAEVVAAAGAAMAAGASPPDPPGAASTLASEPGLAERTAPEGASHLSHEDFPEPTKPRDFSLEPLEVREQKTKSIMSNRVSGDEVKEGDSSTKLGPAVYLCVYIGDPNRGGTAETGWYNSDWIYISILVCDKDGNCKEYYLKYIKPACEGSNPGNNGRAGNAIQTLNHRRWVLEKKNITGHDKKGHKDLQVVPAGGFTGANGVEGYRVEDICQSLRVGKCSYRPKKTTIKRVKVNGKWKTTTVTTPARPASCGFPIDIGRPGSGGTICHTEETGKHRKDKTCNYATVIKSDGKWLDDSNEKDWEQLWGICNYCRETGISMSESTSRDVYSHAETRDTTDFQVIGLKPKFRFAIFMGHADKKITDLGEEAFRLVRKEDAAKKIPLFRGELIKGISGDDLCLRFCMEMMKKLNIRCINPSLKEENEIVESWKKLHEPDFIQCYKILSYIVESKWAWIAGTFGQPAMRSYIDEHLPILSAYIKDIDSGAYDAEVEKILAKKDGKYLVKWKGLSLALTQAARPMHVVAAGETRPSRRPAADRRVRGGEGDRRSDDAAAGGGRGRGTKGGRG